jgi:hypothetical protein
VDRASAQTCNCEVGSFQVRRRDSLSILAGLLRATKGSSRVQYGGGIEKPHTIGQLILECLPLRYHLLQNSCAYSKHPSPCHLTKVYGRGRLLLVQEGTW